MLLVHYIISNLRPSHSSSPGKRHRINNSQSVQARRDYLITNNLSCLMMRIIIRQNSIRKMRKRVEGKFLCFPNTQTITMITLTTKKLPMMKKNINNKLKQFRNQFRSMKTKVTMRLVRFQLPLGTFTSIHHLTA